MPFISLFSDRFKPLSGGIDVGFLSTSTPTPTPSITPTLSNTPTPTPTHSVTPTATLTETPTGTPYITSTPTNTVTPTPSNTSASTVQYYQLNTCPDDGNFYYSKDYPIGTFNDALYPRVTGLLNGVSTTFIVTATAGGTNPSGIEITDTGFYECPPTPSNTPTPTPTTSPIPVTGYSFNLVALPYNFPTTGNTIMNNNPLTTGSTDPSLLATSGRGIYWNSIDLDGVDRTSYFSQFTGQSITITMTQGSSTVIYSGDTNSLKYWTSSPNTGFVFGTGISVPSQPPSGVATLIQSGTTWTIGQSVYISVTINGV